MSKLANKMHIQIKLKWKRENGGALEAAIPYQRSRPLRHGLSSVPFYSLSPPRPTCFSLAVDKQLLRISRLVSESSRGRENVFLPPLEICENVYRALPLNIYLARTGTQHTFTHIQPPQRSSSLTHALSFLTHALLEWKWRIELRLPKDDLQTNARPRHCCLIGGGLLEGLGIDAYKRAGFHKNNKQATPKPEKMVPDHARLTLLA